MGVVVVVLIVWFGLSVVAAVALGAFVRAARRTPPELLAAPETSRSSKIAPAAAAAPAR